MPDWTDKDTDKLFQDGAEKFDFEFNPAAWAQMEKMLDRQKRRRLFWWWFAGLGLVVVAGIVFLSGRNQLVPKESYPVENQDVNASAPDNGAGPPKNSRQTTPGGQPSSDAAIPPGTNARAEAPEEKMVSRIGLSGKSGQGTGPLEKPQPTTPLGQNKVAPSLAPGPGNVDLPISQNYISTLLKSEGPFQAPSPLPATLIKEVRSGHPVQPIPFVPFTGANLLSQNKENDKGGLALTAGLVAGSGLSSAGMGDFTRMSWEAGATLELRYRQRFGLAIGANFIRLHYDAGKGEYVPPKGFWTRKIPPIASRGICQALEIPVDVNYYAGGLGRSGFFASAGLRSFVMLKERYYYSYDLPDPDLRRMWKTDKNSEYWFALWQISVGYNKVFSKITNLTIAPYVQAPLSGIGHGNVGLYSVGTNIRLGFRLK